MLKFVSSFFILVAVLFVGTSLEARCHSHCHHKNRVRVNVSHNYHCGSYYHNGYSCGYAHPVYTSHRIVRYYGHPCPYATSWCEEEVYTCSPRMSQFLSFGLHFGN